MVRCDIRMGLSAGAVSATMATARTLRVDMFDSLASTINGFGLRLVWGVCCGYLACMRPSCARTAVERYKCECRGGIAP